MRPIKLSIAPSYMPLHQLSLLEVDRHVTSPHAHSITAIVCSGETTGRAGQPVPFPEAVPLRSGVPQRKDNSERSERASV